jgi:hypothetical protein
MLNVNKVKIGKMIDLSKSKQYVTAVKSIVLVEFKKIKSELIEEFTNHPVTLEIEGGPSASNRSKTLGGQGNLFSFIGFEENDKPTAVIYKKLNEITLNQTVISRDGRSRTFIYYPTAEEIFKVTPMPWATGRSWAKGIETGIAGLGAYLRKDDTGRSGAGIQSQSKNKGGGFKNTKYISHMIKNFERKILTLDGIRAL